MSPKSGRLRPTFVCGREAVPKADPRDAVLGPAVGDGLREKKTGPGRWISSLPWAVSGRLPF
jgi:hypothetical protein